MDCPALFVALANLKVLRFRLFGAVSRELNTTPQAAGYERERREDALREQDRTSHGQA